MTLDVNSCRGPKWHLHWYLPLSIYLQCGPVHGEAQDICNVLKTGRPRADWGWRWTHPEDSTAGPARDRGPTSQYSDGLRFYTWTHNISGHNITDKRDTLVPLSVGFSRFTVCCAYCSLFIDVGFNKHLLGWWTPLCLYQHQPLLLQSSYIVYGVTEYQVDNCSLNGLGCASLCSHTDTLLGIKRCSHCIVHKQLLWCSE